MEIQQDFEMKGAMHGQASPPPKDRQQKAQSPPRPS
jgi:hypothetical protein